MAWLALAATVVLVLAAEAMALLRPGVQARAAHAALREQWLEAVSGMRGSEVLAVQTIRNSLMSATMVASVAVLGLMGTVSLVATALHGGTGDGLALAPVTPRLAAVLLLGGLLFLALAASVLAARSYHHAGFVAGMPVDSPQRAAWQASGARHLRHAGVLYSWSLRCLLAVAAPVAFILHPLAGPVVALGVLVAMRRMDTAPAAPPTAR